VVFVLVHSPLVGPTTWSPVAHELERRGHRAAVPSLTTPGERDWRHDVAAVCDALRTLTGPVVLVGHSSAGLLLPAIAAAPGTTVSNIVFVDSRVPPTSGETPFLPRFLLDQLRPLAVDGNLPPWPAWFGEDTMRELVPDESLGTRLAREMPSLPLAYLEQHISIPAGWDQTACAYLLLSNAYKEAASEARAREWPLEEITGAQHLHIAVAPEAVADALIRLAAA
jgi:hypothetical protein